MMELLNYFVNWSILDHSLPSFGSRTLAEEVRGSGEVPIDKTTLVLSQTAALSVHACMQLSPAEVDRVRDALAHSQCGPPKSDRMVVRWLEKYSLNPCPKTCTRMV